jgi:hypothetical protein
MNATAVPFIINSDNFIEELSLPSFSVNLILNGKQLDEVEN